MTASSKVPSVCAIGEILWDLLPSGPRFGGAPANFACHAAALGARSQLVSGVGADGLGSDALQILSQRGVVTDLIQISPDKPTGQVQVRINAEGVASYEFGTNEAWDYLVWSPNLAARAEECDAVCFGTLGQRAATSRNTIERILRELPKRCLRVFDINLRFPHVSAAVVDSSLGLASVLKLNEDELPFLASQYGLTGSETELVAQLGQRFTLDLVALTRGPRGAFLWQSCGETSDCPAPQTAVRDTIGAGDAFTAALCVGMIAGWPLARINQHACRVAAWVCTQEGGTPALPQELRMRG